MLPRLSYGQLPQTVSPLLPSAPGSMFILLIQQIFRGHLYYRPGSEVLPTILLA